MPSNDQAPLVGREIHWTPGGESGVTSSTAPRHFDLVQLTLEEIEELRSANNSTDLTFFGISFGALLTVAVTLATVPLPTTASHVIFVVLTAGFALASAVFGVNAFQKHRRWQRKYKRYEKMALRE